MRQRKTGEIGICIGSACDAFAGRQQTHVLQGNQPELQGAYEFHETCHSVTFTALQGSHSHGKSGKVMEKFVVMESHGKVMDNKKNPKSHGKLQI